MSDNNKTEATWSTTDTLLVNLSVEEYLEKQLGPKHLPQSTVIPITVIYISIFLSGLLGNICVCLVIVKKNSMQTSTNYYLFSLAVSDLLLLIFGLPNDLYLFWQQYPWLLGEVMCRTRALISEMTNYASVLTIVAFTVERYIAICHPLLSQTTSSLPRVIKIIATNWIVAAIIATPYAVLTSVHYIEFPHGSKNFIKESAFCMMPTDPKDNPHFRPLLCFSSLAFFFIPMTLIVILYIKIGITLKHSTLQSNECSALHNEGKASARKAIVKMLVAVVIAFIICWAPFHAQRLLFVYTEARHWPASLRKINEILYFAGCVYYFNATINPILYSVMSVKYREAFKEILCENCPCLSFSWARSKTVKQRYGHDNDIMAEERPPSSVGGTYTLWEEIDNNFVELHSTESTTNVNDCDKVKDHGPNDRNSAAARGIMTNSVQKTSHFTSNHPKHPHEVNPTPRNAESHYFTNNEPSQRLNQKLNSVKKLKLNYRICIPPLSAKTSETETVL